MRPIAADGVAWSVRMCVCVCLCVGRVFVIPAKMTEPIQMPRGGLILVGPGTMHYMGIQVSQREGGNSYGLCGLLKSIVSHWCAVCRKELLTASSPLLQPTALLPTGRCCISFPRENNPPAMRPFVKILRPLIYNDIYSPETVSLTSLKRSPASFPNPNALLTVDEDMQAVVTLLQQNPRVLNWGAG